MQNAFDAVRVKCPGAVIAHCRYPAWEAGEWTCTSNPSSIALAFNAVRRVTLFKNGGFREVDITGNAFAIAGREETAWVRVPAPSECIEVTASLALRTQIAHELNVPRYLNLDDTNARHDPVVWAHASELRAILRAKSDPDQLVLEQRVIHLYRHVLKRYFGGRDNSRGDGALNNARATLVFDWIEAHLDRSFSIADLARTASLTTSHFIRSFRRTTGLSPHRYVRARRLERARESLVRGATTSVAATAAGFESLSQFRGAFKRHFGFAPSEIPRPGAKYWILPRASIL
jgi:AraC family transcriptional regulator